MGKRRKIEITLLLIAFFTLLELLAGYIPRTNFLFTIGGYFGLVAIFYFLVKKLDSLKQIFITGLIARIIMLFHLPEWSDDYFRFLWDGELLTNLYNPYKYIPSEIYNEGLLSAPFNDLYPKLNSPNYYTIYPPVVQTISALAVWLSQGNVTVAVVILKLLFLLGEVLSFWFLIKILKKKGREKILVALYWLFPLVIIEFVGNVHFECFMITFLLGSYYYLEEEKFLLSALFLALSFLTKLVPISFAPFFLIYLSWKNRITWSLWLGLFCLIGMSPIILTGVHTSILASVKLYFTSFEFNSSFYLLDKIFHYWYWWYPEKTLKIIGYLLLILIFVMTLWKKKMMILGIILFYSCYLFFSQSIHPWYVIPLLPLTLINGQIPKYIWAWLLLIPLTYVTYLTNEYKQQYWVNVLEYGIVLTLFIWVLLKEKGVIKVIENN